jgi:hypothetical protein|tara:strand:- start:1378 stop:1791 length:414 start_codon:yes stop_codon:yes gene_type:complete
MGTRSLTFVYEKYGDKQMPIINMYRQFDGYPSGHGAELAEFLNGFRIVNGYSGDPVKTANGMSCLSAQLVANFKKDIGQFYLHPTDARDCGQDYEYHITQSENGSLNVSIFDTYREENIFDGSVAELVDFCNVTEDA